MIYQIILLTFGVAFILGAPAVSSDNQQPTVIPIVSQSEELELNGTYKFSYETGNGIKREETSYDKVIPKAKGRSHDSDEGEDSNESDEIHVQQGSYSYTAPDGTVITVRYIADENGFRPIGDHLPKAPSAITPASNVKTGRAFKQLDSSPSGSDQSINVTSLPEEKGPAVSLLSAVIPKDIAEEKTESSTSNDKEEPTADTTSPSPVRSETTVASNSQPEQKTEPAQSDSKVSTESNETPTPAAPGPDSTTQKIVVDSKSSEQLTSNNDSETSTTPVAPTEKSETITTPNSETELKTESALKSSDTDAEDEKSSTTTLAPNDTTTVPSNGDATSTTSVTDVNNTEADTFLSTTPGLNSLTNDTQTTTSAASTTSPSNEEVSTSSPSA